MRSLRFANRAEAHQQNLVLEAMRAGAHLRGSDGRVHLETTCPSQPVTTSLRATADTAALYAPGRRLDATSAGWVYCWQCANDVADAIRLAVELLAHPRPRAGSSEAADLHQDLLWSTSVQYAHLTWPGTSAETTAAMAVLDRLMQHLSHLETNAPKALVVLHISRGRAALPVAAMWRLYLSPVVAGTFELAHLTTVHQVPLSALTDLTDAVKARLDVVEVGAGLTQPEQAMLRSTFEPGRPLRDTLEVMGAAIL